MIKIIFIENQESRIESQELKNQKMKSEAACDHQFLQENMILALIVLALDSWRSLFSSIFFLNLSTPTCSQFKLWKKNTF
jgi:hypothetical protein